MSRKLLSALTLLLFSFGLKGQNNAYIKIFDRNGAHPKVESITFPGDANTLAMYNSIYGHGAVIENLWVAFRVYMDNRQSLDLYVKHIPQLELETTGFYTTPEQLEEGYGCDVLWAGKSIGAGSFRGWQDNRPVTIDTVASRTQTVISEKCIQVIDKDWVFNGKKINMVQNYSMKGDSPDLFVEIKLEGVSQNDLFCTGIQNLESNNISMLTGNVAASWGDNVPDKSHPELIETVGLGIVVNPANIVETRTTDLDNLFIVRPDENGIIRYRVLATGSRQKDSVSNYMDWFNIVNNNISMKAEQ